MTLVSPSDLPETCLLIGSNSGKIERVNAQHHVVKSYRRKGIIEQKASRLGSIALTPGIGFANDDAEFGSSMLEIEILKIGESNWPKIL